MRPRQFFSVLGLVLVAGCAEAGADLDCWDLNNNGQVDPDTEDMNGDGVADAYDCQGSVGSSRNEMGSDPCRCCGS